MDNNKINISTQGIVWFGTIFILLFGLRIVLAQEFIDPRSGYLTLNETDLEVPAGAVALNIQRTLVLFGNESGMLGPRWHLNWDKELLRSESVIMVIEDGELISFYPEKNRSELETNSGDRLELKQKGQFSLKNRNGWITTYDETGRPIEEIDTNGNKISLQYDKNDRLSFIEGPKGAWLKFNMDEKGRITMIEASTDDKLHYCYDNDMLSDVKVNGAISVKYGYNDRGSLVHIERPQTGDVHLVYDDKGRVLSRRWDDESIEYYEYDDATKTIRHIDPLGAITITQRSADGRREEIIDPLGNKTAIEYIENFLPVKIKWPTGATFRMSYDSLGRKVVVQGCCGSSARFEYVGKTDLLKSIIESDGTQYGFSYDDKCNVLAVKRGSEEIYKFSYYPDGLVKSVEGLDSPRRTFSYYPNGLLKSETDALDNTTTYEYDERGNLIREIDALGGKAVLNYDEQNRLTSWIDRSGAKTSFAYDETGHVMKITNPASGAINYAYDIRGRLLFETDPLDRTTRYQYDGVGRLVSVTEPGGSIHRYQYDLAGNMIREINPMGGITTMKHDTLGRLVSFSDPTGRTWKYEYSDAGWLMKMVDPSETATKYQYNSTGRCTAAIDPLGRKTRYQYDSEGRLTKVFYPDGIINSYDYDRAGRLIREADNRGIDIKYAYDALGRPIKETRTPTLEIAYRYDPIGNFLGWHDNFGGMAGFQYNLQNFISASRDVTGATIQYRYNPRGQLLELTDPLGHTTKMIYNAAGELSEIKEPTGDTTKYTYDASGLLSEVRHPGGGTTKLAYDAMGNLAEVTNPIGAKTRNIYDEAGRLVSFTDESGRTITFAYNLANRLVKKRLADGKVVEYKYDPSGNLIEIDDGSFPIQYAYNSAGLMIAITYPAIKRSLQYTYGKAGLLSKFIDSEGHVYNYQYDGRGMLNAIRLPNNELITFGYDAKNRLISKSFPNGIKGVWEYDGLDRPTRIAYMDQTGQTISGWRYSYNAAGNLVSVVDEQGKIIRYEYDQAGQLVEERRSSGVIQYSYQPDGNRSRVTRGGKAVQYQHNQADQLLSAGGETYAYDRNGNLIEKIGPNGAIRYQYDFENRLIRVVKPDGAEISFGYAPTGERIWRKDSNGLIWFITDGTNVLAELNGNLEPEALYLHGPGIDRPLMLERGKQNYFYHTDFLGSVSALTDIQGRIAALYETDAFGNLLAQRSTISNPLMFCGREYEQNLRLYYYRARYYEPDLGRFLSRDPISDIVNLNQYVYVINAPTKYTDPLGLYNMSWSDIFRRGIRKIDPSEVQMPGRYGLGEYPPRGVRGDPRLADLAEPGVKHFRIRGDQEIADLLKKSSGPKAPTSRTVFKMPARYGPGEHPPRGVRGDPRLADLAEPGVKHYRIRGDQKLAELVNKPTGPKPPGTSTAIDPKMSRPPTKPGPITKKWSKDFQPERPNGDLKPPPATGAGLYEKVFGNFPLKLSDTQKTGTWGKVRTSVETMQAPVVHILVTTKQLMECKEQKISAGDCLVKLLKSNVKWRLIQKLALKAGGTKAVIALKIAGRGMMYFQLISDTSELLYNMSSWLAAELEASNIEEGRKNWTETNMRLRLVEDLGAMRGKISRALEDPAKFLDTACEILEEIIRDTAMRGHAAEKEAAKLPSSETIAKWKYDAEKCQRIAEIKERLKFIRNDMWGSPNKIKTELSAVEDADKFKAVINRAQKNIQTNAAEAKQLKSELIAIKKEFDTVQREHQKAMALWDRIIVLENGMVTSTLLNSWIKKSQDVQDFLMKKGNGLKKEVNQLKMAYPDEMKLQTEQKFFELKKEVINYQHKKRCDPRSYLAKYNEAAGMILDAKLTAQSRLKSTVTLEDLGIAECDTTLAETLLSDITKAENEARAALNKISQQGYKPPLYLAWAYRIPGSGVQLDRGLFDVVTKEEYDELKQQAAWDSVVIQPSSNVAAIRYQACAMAKSIAEPEPVGIWGGGPGCIIKFGEEICYPVLDCNFDICEQVKTETPTEKVESDSGQDKRIEHAGAVKLETRAAVDVDKRIDNQRESWKGAVDVSRHKDQPIKADSIVPAEPQFSVSVPKAQKKPKKEQDSIDSSAKQHEKTVESEVMPKDADKTVEKQKKMWVGAVDTKRHKDKQISRKGAVELEPRATVDVDERFNKQKEIWEKAVDSSGHKDQPIKPKITAKDEPQNDGDVHKDSRKWNPFQQEKEIDEKIRKEMTELQLINEPKCKDLERQFELALDRASDMKTFSVANDILREAFGCPFRSMGLLRLEGKVKQERRRHAAIEHRLKQETALKQQQWRRFLKQCDETFISAIRNFETGNPRNADYLLLKAYQARCPIWNWQYAAIQDWKYRYSRERIIKPPPPISEKGYDIPWDQAPEVKAGRTRTKPSRPWVHRNGMVYVDQLPPNDPARQYWKVEVERYLRWKRNQGMAD